MRIRPKRSRTPNGKSDSSDRLQGALDRLDDRSRDILQRRWMSEDKATLHELADKYGVSAERIRQIESNAMGKLRGLMSQSAAGLSLTHGPRRAQPARRARALPCRAHRAPARPSLPSCAIAFAAAISMASVNCRAPARQSAFEQPRKRQHVVDALAVRGECRAALLAPRSGSISGSGLDSARMICPGRTQSG